MNAQAETQDGLLVYECRTYQARFMHLALCRKRKETASKGNMRYSGNGSGDVFRVAEVNEHCVDCPGPLNLDTGKIEKLAEEINSAKVCACGRDVFAKGMCGTCYHRARRNKAQTRGRTAFQQDCLLLRRARSISDSAGGKVTLELLVEKLRVRERRAQRVLGWLEGE